MRATCNKKSSLLETVEGGILTLGVGHLLKDFHFWGGSRFLTSSTDDAAPAI